MKKYIQRIVSELKADGIELDVYSARGELLFSSGSTYMQRKVGEKPLLKDGDIYERDGLTFFRVRLKEKSFIICMEGVGQEARLQATLLRKLIERSMEREAETTEDSFRSLFNGKLSKTQTQQLVLTFPLQAKETYYCLLLSCSIKHQAALTDFLKTLCQPTDIITSADDSGIIFLKTANDSEEYQSDADFAYMLSGNITEELGITPLISVGNAVRGFDNFRDAYLNALDALRLGKMLDPSYKVYYYKDYLLVKLFEQLSKQEMLAYLNLSTENMNKAIFQDEEIMYTAEQFLHNNLNISETARLLYLHRNTLIYRLDKLEKETGLNIRRFADAMVFRSLRIITKLL